MFIGYIYDLLGRYMVILLSSFGSALMLAIIPFTAPNHNLFIITFLLFNALISISGTNPLIPDYIRSDSRGQAVALKLLGLVFGELFNAMVLFGLTVEMDLNHAFIFSSIIVGVLNLPLPFLMREVEIKEKNSSVK